MKTLLITLLFITGALAEDLTTLKGKTYKDARIMAKTPGAITVSHADGMVEIRADQLTEDQCKKYGIAVPAKPAPPVEKPVTLGIRRVGETREQCDARYGKPEFATNSSARYEKKGLSISILFNKGLSYYIRYSKLEKDALDQPVELSDAEIEALLEANGGGAAWRNVREISLDKSWETDDGKLYACKVWTDHTFVVCDVAVTHIAGEEGAAKEKAALKGL